MFAWKAGDCRSYTEAKSLRDISVVEGSRIGEMEDLSPERHVSAPSPEY